MAGFSTSTGMPENTPHPAAPPFQIRREQSPAHLRAVAHLYGIEAAPATRARVLALGCAAGNTMLPFAAGHPDAVVVVVDLDPQATQSCQQQAEVAGIRNIQFHALDIGTLLAQQGLGEFDYILVSGVYSLVDSSVRREILKFCQRYLAPAGIACFEYSTQPGSKINEIVRDALALHTSLASNEAQQLESARAMLAFLAQGVSAANPLAGSIRELAAQAERHGDVDLALRYLQGLNEPCHFVEFHDLAVQAGLCYVGDANPHLELPQAWGANVEQLCQAINPSGNKVLGQQYLDFACNRASRLSLLANQSLAVSVLPLPDLQRLPDLRWGGYFKRARVNGTVADGHDMANGQQIGTPNAMALSILDTLGYAWPASVGFETLEFNAEPPIVRLKEERPDTGAQVLQALQNLFIKLGSQLKYSLDPSPYDKAATRCVAPIAGIGAIATQDVQPGQRCSAFNLWHEQADVELDALDQAVLLSLDGKLAVGRLPETVKVGLGEDDRDTGTRIRDSLAKLHSKGLLNGSGTAWTDYWAESLPACAAPPRYDSHALYSLMFHALPHSKGDNARAQPAGKRGAPPPANLLTEVKQIRKLLQDRQAGPAQKAAHKLVQTYPNSPAAWSELHRTLLVTHQQESLLEAALRAISLQPDRVGHYHDAAAAYGRLGQPWNARHMTERVLRAAPGLAIAWSQLGMDLGARHALTDAELCYREAIRLSPDLDTVRNNLASNLSTQSRLPEALELYEEAIRRNPANYSCYSNYLFSCLHAGYLTPQEIFRRHREFGKSVEAHLSRSVSFDHSNLDRNPDRPLRIGFVSADLRNHAVAHFLEPYWTNLDKSQFHIYAYSNSNTEDDVSRRFRAHASSWHRVTEMDDAQLARLIAREQVDILFDLSGHTAHNRLPMFGYKPAPIQITWIGYPGTTGLKAMDYLIARRNVVAPGVVDNQFTEKLVYLDVPLLFQPHPASPEVSPLPSLEGKPFTFGSFNRPQKLSDEVLRAWADILHATPGSRLLQGNMESNAESTMANRFVAKMAEFGIPADRLVLRDRVNLPRYLEMHGEIDVLLDTFPYSGGTTTNHALWMGVPTVTVTGPTPPSMAGASRMRQWGLDAFIADSRQAYIDCAASWFHRQAELAEIRRTLRQRIASASSISNLSATHALEQALRHVWRRWCAGLPPEPAVLES